MRYALPLLALSLSACATAGPAPTDGLSRARIGQEVNVGGPKVTPLAVLEDSRCPAQVTCVWAGRLRISARITLGSGSQTRELTLGEPIQVADGSLELVEALPRPDAKAATDPKVYRFAFRFMGGL